MNQSVEFVTENEIPVVDRKTNEMTIKCIYQNLLGKTKNRSINKTNYKILTIQYQNYYYKKNMSSRMFK
jgi:hypothetical protein